ncbi:aminotransferase class V-fold PLP-dependent enzyme [Thermogemmatispora sp.]|uniref:aminotransferase class V-fold PLP-dependent enzyme n=1 Tax=Thermogemmatispora sp. TaxID=1968838 RepID=UPI0035E410D4
MERQTRAFDLAQARAETPGCAEVLHFNNAGAALMPQPVLEAVSAHLQREARHGGYEAAEEMREALTHVYEAVATLLGCQPSEVALLENATRAWDMAFYAIPFAPGDRILTGMAEYASNYLAFLQMSRRRGVRVEVIPDDEYGQISLSALRNALDEHVRLIALTHVPTNNGLVNPAAEVGRLAREAGVLYLLDATQSVGQMPLDVGAIGCDMLAATGRKYLRAPRGTGFLYVRQEVLEELEPPLIDLHSASWTAPDQYSLSPNARRFECWEASMANRLGLGAAIDYLLQWDQRQLWRRIRDLAYLLRTRLSPLPGVIVHDRGAVQGGIVTFTVEGQEAETIRQALRQQGINVSVVPREAALLDMQARGLQTLVRASVHYYNSEEEVERFSRTLEHLLTDGSLS